MILVSRKGRFSQFDTNSGVLHIKIENITLTVFC